MHRLPTDGQLRKAQRARQTEAALRARVEELERALATVWPTTTKII